MRRRVHLLAALGVGEDLGSVLKVREGLAAEVLLAAVVAHVQRHVGEDLDQRGLGREVAAVHAAADEGRLAAARGAEQLGVLVDVQLAQVALALQELDGLAQGVRIARVAQRGEALGLEEVQVAPAAAAAAAASLAAADPWPWREVTVIMLINGVNSASYLMTYPFVSFMLLSFDASLRPEDVGFYSGVLEGAFHVGSFFGSILWGFLADAYGRRPALLAGLLGTIAATLSFGFASSFAAAVATRLLWGALNGNVGVAKTALSEVCSDRHTARAFAAIGLANGFGRLVGPAVGGLLAEPARKYGWTFPLLVAFPFALPCLVAAAAVLLTFCFAAVVLKETLPAAAATAAAPPAPAAMSEAQVPPAAAAAEVVVDDETAKMLVSAPAALPAAATPAVAAGAAPSPPGPAPARRLESPFSSMARLWRDPAVRACVTLYCGLGMAGLVSVELYPLYMLNDPAHGGFALDSSAIGLLALSGGPWMILSQAFLFERCSAALGVLRFWELSLAAFALCLASTPLQSLANALPERAQWAVLMVHYGVTTFVRVNCFTLSFIFTANSALPEDRSKVNGLGQAAVSVVRAVGPPIGTASTLDKPSPTPPTRHLPLTLALTRRHLRPAHPYPYPAQAIFAWSVSSGLPWPLDYSLVFYLLAAGIGLLILQGRRLPRWIVRKRTSADLPAAFAVK